RWRPDIGSPAIGWIVGHILVDHDIVGLHRLCNKPLLFEDLIPTYGITTDGNFPEDHTLKDLFEKFKQLNSEIVSVLATKTEDWLDEKFDTSGFPPNWENKGIGKAFIMHFNHGITHTGQILEIRRMRGLDAWGF
ncbi:MAG: DinB family protein, partial [Candidatus Heimdallarchaeota archaeon]